MSIRKVGQDEAVTKRVTCRKCGSILEYLPVDVQHGTSTDYTGVSDTYSYIKCSECNNTVYVK
jgi:ribosomal protein S27E